MRELTIKFGVYVPNFGRCCSDPHQIGELANVAEESGWDGFFLWDHLLWTTGKPVPVGDSLIGLASISLSTKEIRLGTMITPIPRYRPWRLARETVSLDLLSNGRLTLGVGLGEPMNADFKHFGEDPDRRTRGEKLDEGLHIVTGLWSGKPFSHNGKHYSIAETVFLPTPVQTPRIPVWVAGVWPRKPPFRRAAQWDGVVPLKHGQMTPNDLKSMLDYVGRFRKVKSPFDVAVIGRRDLPTVGGAKDSKKISLYFNAGATWWLESMYTLRDSSTMLKDQIARGPPREN